MGDFVHLHVHSQYSFLDSSIRIPKLVERVKELGMSAVALTDHDSMMGAVDFYKAGRAAEIRPILGCEPTVALKDARDPKDTARYQIVLLARNQEGYRNLCRLSHLAHEALDAVGHARLDPRSLAEHAGGLVLLTGGLAGDIPQLLLHGEHAEARERLRFYRDALGPEHVFVELQDHGIVEERDANRLLVELARSEGAPIVATNDAHYLHPEDRESHEVLMAIGLGRRVDWDDGREARPGGFHLATAEEMAERFKELPEAIANTVRVAEMCDVEIGMGTYYLPQVACPEGQTLDDVLTEMAAAGLQRRLAELRERGESPDEAAYDERMRYELGVVCQMGFPGYFIIVADYVQWARDHQVPVGPGRGSGAGSVVAWALRITDLDPVRYGLLFERFLNPERVSMPDFDVDFCQSHREKVIDYAISKYGQDNVAQIITYGAMKAKAVVRDVARALGMTAAEGDRIAKLIPAKLDITLEDAYKEEPRLRELMEEDERYARLFEVARELEGLYRQAGIHASAVVISDDPLWTYMPTTRGANGELVTQYAMGETEEVGLVKFDFLGLKTLTVLDEAERLVRRHLREDFRLAALSLDDAKTYELISSGNTLGVFQLESSGFQDILRRLRPDCFEDIVAAVALYRPGPLTSGMADDFIKRKHGQTAVEYPHPWLEDCLRETHGVIVYQEQVMQIASRLAGFSLGQADLLRRAMGKKKPEAMAKMRAIFQEGAAAKGVDPKTAETLFDIINKFAGYGFNKSHSAAYAVLTYQTAYLKTHYPSAFFAAMLSSDAQKTEKVVRYVFEARRMGIEVLPPDANESEQGFSLSGSAIRFGLSAVRGVGEAAVEAILEARADGGPFSTLADFCSRVDLRRVNRRTLEALAACGAFDSTGLERDVLLHNVPRALEAGARYQEDQAQGQYSLFGDDVVGDGDGVAVEYAVPDLRMSRRELLRTERETLGFYISGHPLEGHEEELKALGGWTTAAVTDDATDGQEVTLGGVVAELKERRTRKDNKRMAVIQLEDLHGRVEVVVFPGVYDPDPDDPSRQPPGQNAGAPAEPPVEQLLQSDLPIVVSGKVRVSDDETSSTVDLTASAIRPLGSFRAERAKGLTIVLPCEPPKGWTATELVDRLATVLESHRGAVPVFARMELPGSGTVALQLPPDYTVSPSDAFIADLREVIEAPPIVTAEPGPSLPQP